jgi:competence protein ComEC
VSLVAVPANVLAEPVVAPATVLGFGAAVVAPAAAGLGRVLAWAAGWPCRWLVAVADRFGGVDGAAVPWPSGAVGGFLLLSATAAVWAVARHRRARSILAVGAALCALVQLPLRAATTAWPPAGWLFVACDIGQGDGLVLNAGPGSAVVIDTGPDPVPMEACLHGLGVAEVPLLAITHDHLDHIGGIAGVFHGRRVGAVITGPSAEPAAGAQTVHREAAEHGLPVRVPAPGASATVGAVHLAVLGPAAAFQGTRSDPNNSSLVLRATVRGVRILLPGDAEVEAQRALLDGATDLRADVLKVPHHGSAYSDPDFLAAVHARLGVISVGLHNDYGHPSPLLLSEMRRLGVPVLRTDLDGDVAVTVSAGRLGAVTHHPSPAGVSLGAAVWTGPAAASVPGDRMAACLPAPRRGRSRATPCRTSFPRSCWSSGTRSCSSPARSARSPPRCAGQIPTWSRPSGRLPTSTGRSCTSCSGRRCSATPGCW